MKPDPLDTAFHTTRPSIPPRRIRHFSLTAIFWAKTAVMAIAVMTAPMAVSQEQAAAADDAELVEPRVIRPTATGSPLIVAERTCDGQWFVLLQSHAKLPDILEFERIQQRLLALPERSATGEINGLRIRSIEAGSFPAEAGLQVNDVLVRINDTPMQMPVSLAQFATANPRARDLSIVYRRGDDEHTMRARIFYLPEPSPVQHTVESTDTLENLAVEFYGHTGFTRLIRRENQLTGHDALTVGQRLTLPVHPALRQPARELEPGTWLIPADEAATVRDSFSLLVRQLRPTPTVLDVDGTPVPGLRLAGVQPRALPFRRGFQRGDTITHINGMRLKTGADLLECFNRFRDHQFIDVRFFRGDPPLPMQRIFCVLPAPSVSTQALLPPPIVASPADFACVEITPPPADLAAEWETRVIAWKITAAQSDYLSRHYREIFADVHLAPVVLGAESPAEARFLGVRLTYIDADTIAHAYGFRKDDVITAMRIDAGEWHPVRAGFQLVDCLADHANPRVVDFRFRRDATEWVFRAVIEPSADGDANSNE